MRLIDADALLNELEKVRCSLQMNDNTQRADLIMSGLYVAKRHIQEMPTVDAEPVIRCKDCALWDDADSEHLVGYCTEGDGEKITFRNEWCCWAERKEE